MPYVIDDNNCIHKQNADGTMGEMVPGTCHDTRDEAEAQMAAMYAAENKAAEPEPEPVAGDETKVGRRNSASDAARIQAVHDMAKELGAMCDDPAAFPRKDVKGESIESLLTEIDQAFRSQYPYPGDAAMPTTDAGFWIVEHEDDAIIVENKGKYYRVAYAMLGDEITFAAMNDWQEVERKQEWVAKTLAHNFDSDLLVTFGGTVKALGDGRVGGYLVTFSTEDDPDLEGDFFTKDTDFGPLTESAVLYHHGMDAVLKRRRIGIGPLKKDDVGVWIEAQLEMRDEYEKAIYELVEAGKLGLSSGTAGHLVEREPVGKAAWIKSWPLGLDASLTPAPAEPRNKAMTLKTYLDVTAKSTANEGLERPDGEKGAETQPAIKTKEKTMSDENKSVETKETPQPEIKMPEIDYDLLADKLAERLDAPVKSKAAPMTMKSENLGDPDPLQAVARWLRGDDNVKALGAINARRISRDEIEFLPSKAFKAAYQEGTYSISTIASGGTSKAFKAAYQEGTAGEGGNLVPNDFYAGIIAKRDQASIARRAGARVFRTSRDVIDIPYEDTSVTNFTLTAEEGDYDEAEATFGNAQAIVYKYTKMNKISEELIEDDATNLDEFLTDAFGRAWGLAENAFTLTGTGSAQPQGVFVGGSVGYTFADTNAIAATEIPQLYWSLGDQYHEGAVWVTRGATAGHLQSLTGNNFQLIPTPPDQAGAFMGAPWVLWTKPAFLSDSVAAIAASAKTIIFGNWNYYALLERHGIVIKRNPYLYQKSGQIGIFAKVRAGGIVLQPEAFKWGIQAAS